MTQETQELTKSYNIQRLGDPKIPEVSMLAFGGGLRFGGLPVELARPLLAACSFDYMGYAEFEWGALPTAIHRMLGTKLVAFSLDVETDDAISEFQYEANGRCTGTVYIICPEEWKEEVARRITKFALREGAYRTRARVALCSALRCVTKGAGMWPSGWIEIDNGYAFFLSKQMFDAFCVIFAGSLGHAEVAEK